MTPVVELSADYQGIWVSKLDASKIASFPNANQEGIFRINPYHSRLDFEELEAVAWVHLGKQVWSIVWVYSLRLLQGSRPLVSSGTKLFLANIQISGSLLSGKPGG